MGDGVAEETGAVGVEVGLGDADDEGAPGVGSPVGDADGALVVGALGEGALVRDGVGDDVGDAEARSGAGAGTYAAVGSGLGRTRT